MTKENENEKELTYILLKPSDIGMLMRSLVSLMKDCSLSIEHQRGIFDDRHLMIMSRLLPVPDGQALVEAFKGETFVLYMIKGAGAIEHVKALKKSVPGAYMPLSSMEVVNWTAALKMEIQKQQWTRYTA